MKRLFFSAFALVLGSLAFISCNDDDKVGTDEGKNGDKYMTLAEQQQAIQTSIDGVADAIEFTELTQAADVIAQAAGKKWSFLSLMPILNDSVLMQDSIFMTKLSYAMQLVTGDYQIFEGKELDLSPLYMTADINVVDTVIYGDTISALVLGNINYDVDYLLLNVFIEDHAITVKAKIESGESEFDYVNVEKNINARLPIPELIDITLSLDGKVLADVKSEYDSDYVISFTNDTISSDDEESFVVEGSKMSVKASAKIAGYELNGKLDFDEETGFEGSFAAKYGNSELFSANGKIAAVFKDVDFTDSVSMMIWAQNPELLKSMSANASLGGGAVEFKGSLENPFKDKDLAKYMGTLMTGTILSDEEFEDMVAKFNELFKVGVYFKGYNQPQAVLKVKYIKDADKPAYDEEEDEELSMFDVIGAQIMKAGGYMVFVVHDENGNEVEVSPEEYFGKIDVSYFVKTIQEKFAKAFGPYLVMFEEEEEEE